MPSNYCFIDAYLAGSAYPQVIEDVDTYIEDGITTIVTLNPTLPAELGRLFEKALEKDRALRYQSATELKTDLLRVKRKTDSGGRRAVDGDCVRSRHQNAG